MLHDKCSTLKRGALPWGLWSIPIPLVPGNSHHAIFLFRSPPVIFRIQENLKLIKFNFEIQAAMRDRKRKRITTAEKKYLEEQVFSLLLHQFFPPSPSNNPETLDQTLQPEAKQSH